MFLGLANAADGNDLAVKGRSSRLAHLILIASNFDKATPAMQPPGIFHHFINRIQLGVEDRVLCKQLLELLQPMAPSADFRCTHTHKDTAKLISLWHPALLIIELAFNDENFLSHIDGALELPLAPFTLGIADHTSGADVAQAMRYGFSDVIDKPIDVDVFQRKVHTTVTRLPLLPVHIGQIVYPYLYSGTPMQMRKLFDDIDHYIFDLALQINSSKNGVSKMLGISRQLVQYRLKKSNAPQH